MGWIPYPNTPGFYANGTGATGQSGAAQDPASFQGGYGSTAHLQAIAASQMPHTSGIATGLQALAGYMAGQQQSQAGQPAAPASTDDDTTGTPPATGWGAAGQGIGQAISRKSDRRLKSDVTRIGTLPNGLPVYRYRLEGGPFEIGCMADEIAQILPDATWFDPDDGFARVDYSKVL